MNFNRLLVILTTIIILLSLAIGYRLNKNIIAKDRPLVVCTTSIIADTARNITGDAMQVIALMGPGIDPHLYKPVETDVIKIASADIIFYNGLHLEAKMADLFADLARHQTTVAISKDIDQKLLIAVDDYQQIFDPHIWFDINLWICAVQTICQTLMQKFPEHAIIFQENCRSYQAQLTALLLQTQQIMQTIPKKQRILITGHDAFSYFGKVYDCTVIGLQGISTESSPGAYDIAQIITTICQQNIPAIFIESSIPIKNIIAVQQGVTACGKQIAIGGKLYSDALGGKHSDGSNYIAMIEHNVQTIANALRSC